MYYTIIHNNKMCAFLCYFIIFYQSRVMNIFNILTQNLSLKLKERIPFT